MVATVISIVASLALCAGMDMVPNFDLMVVYPGQFFAVFFFVCLLLSLLPWLGMLFLSQSAEVVAITIAALRSNVADKRLYVYAGAIQLVSFLGLFFCFQGLFSLMWTTVGTVLCTGVVLDLLRGAYLRLQYRRTPEGIGEWFIEVTKESVRRRDERWYTIAFEIPFSMMLVYMKGGAYGSMRLFWNRIAEISDLWLSSMARLLMFRVPGEGEDMLLDRYAHAELMTAKRIRWLLQEAAFMGSIAGIEEITRLAARLFISFYNCHKSLGFLLLQTVSRASKEDHGRMKASDLNMEILSSFAEVVKMLIARSLERNISEEATILKVLSMIEDTVKSTSLDEKTNGIAFLMRPIIEIHHMLGYSRYQNFLGHEIVLEETKRILALFSAAEGAAGRAAVPGRS